MAVEVEYQRALYQRINAARMVLGITGVHDVAPQAVDGGNRSAFPYVVMGLIFPVEDDTQGTLGFQVTTRLHIYSRSGAMRECKLIQAGLYGILHRQPLDLVGFNEYDLNRQDTDCTADQDGQIHGVCEYLGLVQTTP